MKVEVVYAPDSQKQTLLIVEVPEGATVSEAITASGILERYPAINLNTQRLGIFSQRASLADCLQAGDRIEIYRPLLIDPKAARRLRGSGGK